MLEIVRMRTLVPVAVTGILTSCALLQPDGVPDPRCHFAPGTQLSWQGQGAPTDFGLSAEEQRAGTIYVEVYPEARADGEQPAQTWCIVIDEGGGRTSSAGGTVPQQWLPPP